LKLGLPLQEAQQPAQGAKSVEGAFSARQRLVAAVFCRVPQTMDQNRPILGGRWFVIPSHSSDLFNLTIGTVNIKSQADNLLLDKEKSNLETL